MNKRRLMAGLTILILGTSLLSGCSETSIEPDNQNKPVAAFYAEDIPAENPGEYQEAGGTEGVTEEAKEEAKEEGQASLNDLENTQNETSAIAIDTAADTDTDTEHTTLRLMMVGDILLHTKVSDSAKMEDGTYDYSPIFAHTKELISEADLALVNEEVILGGEKLGVSGYPAFNAPYEVGDALVESGFDVILHATNHAVDKGKKGLVNCMNYWQEAHPEIAVLGIHDSSEDQEEIFYYEQNGIKLAILNYTYGTNGISLPADMPWSVDLLDEAKVIRDLEEAEANADFTVVCPHWGTEYHLGISDMQKKWTRVFVEHGADLILGTHPHVIEPVEWYEDQTTGNRALVYYSIGNFVNWTSGTGDGAANRMVGGLADVTLRRVYDASEAANESSTVNTGHDSKVMIDSYTVHGLVCHLEEGTGGVTTYLLRDYSSELGERNQMRLQDNSFSYDYCVNLCDRVWTNWE